MSITSKFAPPPLLPLLAIVAALLILPGCKSSAKHDDGSSGTATTADASAASAPAIYCDKCKTTFARAPVTGGSSHEAYGVKGYRSVTTHECDECRSVATGILTQGKTTRPGEVVHTCKICGGTMTACYSG